MNASTPAPAFGATEGPPRSDASSGPGADPVALVRADLRDFGGYASARSARLQGDVWLNANESAWANGAVGTDGLRRYPEPQPAELRTALAALYGCLPAQLLAGRGSDEGIDLLVRAVCRPGGDAVVVCPPTFGMYAVSARLNGTRLIEVPLIEVPPVDSAGDGDGAAYACDFEAVARAAEAGGARLVFLCSPGNPTGNLLPLAAIESLATRLDGRALVVVDEAYGEFADAPSATTLLARRRNIVVLRTLSKAHALAAARIGCVIADAGLIAVLQRCQAPYPLPAPCVELALRALEPAARGATRAHVAQARAERLRLQSALQRLPLVRRIYPSQANFLLVRFTDAQAAFDALLAAGIVVRDQRGAPGLGDALRITVGTAGQNTRVIDALAALEPTA